MSSSSPPSSRTSPELPPVPLLPSSKSYLMTVGLSPSTKRKQEEDQQSSNGRKKLRIEIPVLTGLAGSSTSDTTDSLFSSTSYDSLFDEPVTVESANDSTDLDVPPLALHHVPSINGLYFDPTLRISQEIADSVVSFCMKTYFTTRGANQVMLFGRAPAAHSSSLARTPEVGKPIGLPLILCSLLDTLRSVLHPILPASTHSLLFPSKPTMARQAIINLYEPGEGITPHVDLLGRYADGIIGVSFGSGCVMRFDKVPTSSTPSPLESSRHEEDQEQPETDSGELGPTRWDLYLPERSMIVLSKEARYDWTHGIDKRTRDYVACGHGDVESPSRGRWIDRDVRISVTFRWMLEGADVVG